MNSETPRPLSTALAQTATARAGVSGNRIRASSLARVAESLREHGLSAVLHPTGRLHVVVSTSRFTAQALPGAGGAIEVRVKREGRHSILGLLTDPEEVAHLLIQCAGMTSAWELNAAVYDRLVLAGEASVLSEVPMGTSLFVRLGERTYAEFVAEDADACLGVPASVSLTTHICPQPVRDVWNYRTLHRQDFPTMGLIEGGRHTTADAALAALEMHRARTGEWENLH
ncbi:hypothetical protein [Tsukamurella sp. 1534]|uniref:hypothetical protein n=1 Tax=Tsukamurella sp. 1534 TaxID=1151061 RepID=UPI0011D1F1BA|nr:hypothetical protein [Tsukamurella sp. 1534]